MVSEDVKAYVSSLSDLTFNSKPLINMLTMLADENIEHAEEIVQVVENHLTKVQIDVKLPILYLIDCICKNVGGRYTDLFSQNIVATFCSVFRLVDEKTRAEMFKLRQTWNEVFNSKKLYAIDVQISLLDPAWPVTAQLPPSSSIHLNPKFLKNTTTTTQSNLSANTDTSTDTGSLDIMQQQLLQKQRELLELQQKKVELELLQARVKLREHKTTPNVVQLPDIPHNVLLKPEVAKQLAPPPSLKVQSYEPMSRLSNSSSKLSVMNQRMQQQQIANSAPKITPVNSGLVAAVSNRPVRDPRLQRQQQQQQLQQQLQQQQLQQQQQQQLQHQQLQLQTSMQHSNTTNTTNNNSISTTVQLEPKNTLLESTNKIVNNRLANVRSEPRPLENFINKNEPNSQKSTVNLGKGKKSSKMRSDEKSKSSRTYFQSRESKSSPKSSSSSLDSPSKKSDKSPISKSPTAASVGKSASARHKNKDLDKISDVVRKSSKRNSDSTGISSGGSGAMRVLKSSKSDTSSSNSTPSSSVATSPTSFKAVKSKNRNYMRRNRSISRSPETTIGPPVQDVDLRVATGPPPEKQARLLSDSTTVAGNSSVGVNLSVDNKITLNQKSEVAMDVDLRQLPSALGKKRLSTESPPDQTTSKKSKLIDVLFGSEDTDLRQLTVTPDRPPTPPPPIISQTDTPDEVEMSPKKNTLDAVRAKLANATNKDKVLSKSYHKKALEKLNIDPDARLKSSPPSQSKLVISPDEQKIITDGNMTTEQQKHLMTKIIAQLEKQKLMEAKKKDKEESIGNVSLQPISDDEFENDFSGDDDDDEQPYSPQDPSFADKDERLHLPSTPLNQNFEVPPLPPPPTWRGGRGRGGPRFWDSMGPPSLPHRGSFRGGPWMNSTQWRPLPMGNFMRPLHNIGMHPPQLAGQQLGEDAESRSSPNSNEVIVEPVNPDQIKTINIDGTSKVIRYYDETAIIFMSWDDPREVCFQNGTRRVIFNETEIYMLNFNDPELEIKLGNSFYRVRLGAPTREIYIDQKPYECYIGGPAITIDLDGNKTLVQIDGPPPQVKIADQKTDLVGGTINLIVDAKMMFPLFLDDKIQTFTLRRKLVNLQFIDALKAACINQERVNIEFGGLPMSIVLNGYKHYVRFTVLPKGIRPGVQVRIRGLEAGGEAPASPKADENVDSNEPVLPVPLARVKNSVETASPENSSSAQFFQNVLHQQNLSNLDLLSSVISSSTESPANTSGYQVETTNGESQENPKESIANTNNTSLAGTGFFNISELFQKLVATGIVTSSKEAAAAAAAPAPAAPPIVTSTPTPKQKHPPVDPTRRYQPINFPPMTFDKPETLKVRQPFMYQQLYAGMQCSSCGMRFPPEQSLQYSQHLDWHFRQNRKGKKNARVASSRRWYYSIADWQNYEEIEDLEEREKNYFDQQSQAEKSGEEANEAVEVPSVIADPELADICEICGDKFEIFFNEEKEEWHFRNAIREDDKSYHPVCYDDHQISLANQESEESASSQKELIPGIEIVLDDDDSEDDSSKDVDQVIIDDDESKLPDETTDNKTNEKAADDKANESPAYEDEDDDVILKEEAIEKIVIDDNDDKEDSFVSPGAPSTDAAGNAAEPIADDGFMDVGDSFLTLHNGEPVKIKREKFDAGYLDHETLSPAKDASTEVQDESIVAIDEDDEPAVPEEPEEEQVHTGFLTSIDGNLELDTDLQPVQQSVSVSKIKININKPLPVITSKDTNKDLNIECNPIPEPVIDPSQPLPPGEEVVSLKLKPGLQGVDLKLQSPILKGSELTGMCSIM